MARYGKSGKGIRDRCRIQLLHAAIAIACGVKRSLLDLLASFPGLAPVFDHLFLHTASDQKLELGKAWE